MVSKNKKLGVGVIGVGAIGRVHAKHVSGEIPQTSLVGIADSFVDVAKRVGSELGVDEIYSDYNELLKNPEVEAIVIATPPFLKREIILKAAQAGKHVFVEKPMTLSLKEADDIIREADSSGIKVQVGYQRRFDNSFLRAYQSIRSGEIGRILLVTSCTRDPPGKPSGWSLDPKLSGGMMLDTCSHDFDVIRWLAHDEVVRVYAHGVTIIYDEFKPGGIPDNVVITLDLKSGAIAHVDSCQWTVYGYDVRAEVLGTDGAAFVGIGDKSSATIMSKEGYKGEYPGTFIERFDQAYRDEVADFANCVLENKPVKVTPRDGRAAMEIGLAADLSMKNDAPVTLPLN